MKLEKIKNIALEDIIEFRDHGDMSNVPEEIVFYLQEMEKVLGMSRRFDKYSGRDGVINHLVKFDGYSQYLASKLYDDTIEYFYFDRGISFKSYVNRISEKMEKAADLALLMAENTNDVVKSIGAYKQVIEVIEKAKDNGDEIPQELLDKPVKLYTMVAKDLGLPEANRYELGRFIDELPDLTEAQRMKAKRDAQLKPIKAFKE